MLLWYFSFNVMSGFFLKMMENLTEEESSLKMEV